MYFITTEARLAKDWGQADNIRSQLSDEGVPWWDEPLLPGVSRDAVAILCYLLAD